MLNIKINMTKNTTALSKLIFYLSTETYNGDNMDSIINKFCSNYTIATVQLKEQNKNTMRKTFFKIK